MNAHAAVAASVADAAALAAQRLGAAAEARGDWNGAMVQYAEAVHHDVRLPGILRDFGRVSAYAGHSTQAEEALAAAVSLDPSDVDAARSLAHVLYDQGKFAEAASVLASAATRARDACMMAELGMALLSAEQGAEAEACFIRAKALDHQISDEFTRAARADWSRRLLARATAAAQIAHALDDSFAARWLVATIRVDAGTWEEDEAARFALDAPQATLDELRNTAQECEARRPEAALRLYEAIVARAPNDAHAIARVLEIKPTLCDWRGYDAFVTNTAAAVERADAADELFSFYIQELLNIPLSTAVVLKAIRARVRRVLRETAAARARITFDFTAQMQSWRTGSRRLRIGYVIPVSYWASINELIKGMIARHDRSRFEVFAYCLEPNRSTGHEPGFEALFDRFRYISREQYEESARIIVADGIDVLLETTGHSQTECQHLVAMRPAPVQVQIVGYGSTTQAPYVDYLVTDRVWLRPSLEAACVETPVLLPQSWFVGYRAPVADRAYTRAELGLPENGFVYCTFNQFFKLDPGLFDVWMRILHRTPGSVLWCGSWNPTIRRNLCREAAARGIDPARLVFADIVPHAQHLARLRHADLALDTRTQGGGATTIDALWAGVPVLTSPDELPNSVNGLTIAGAFGMPELAVSDLRGYEEMAVALATDRARYVGLRAKVAAQREHAPLFDADAYMRQFDAAILMMWEHKLRGDTSRPLIVPTDPALRGRP